MNMSSVREEIFDRVMSLDSEEFEQFCKILVEQVERPTDIELTPFNSDGGIDIRGSVGRAIYESRFGVQVKQFEANIGSPSIRNFIGALSQHHYQFGTFITTSGYAAGVQEIIDGHPTPSIILINRNRLLDIMVKYEVGVRQDADSHNIDNEFWEIFEKTQTDNPVKSEEVPQADSLEVVKTAVIAIDRGHRYTPEIKEFMERETGDDWTRRQGDYYPIAGYALGYVHKDTVGEYNGQKMRQWGLTRDGQELVQLIDAGRTEEVRENLFKHIRAMEISKRILPKVKEAGSISHSRLKELVLEESQLNQTTSERRANTLGKWFAELPEINRRSSVGPPTYEYIEVSLSDF